MTESIERSTESAVPSTPSPQDTGRSRRLYEVLAWVGIVAGILFIVAVVFFSGFFVGRAADGYGWHRGSQSSQMKPGAGMGGGCPMMQGGGMMGPGGMGGKGSGGMGQGGMGQGGTGPGSAPSSSMPMPMPGQR